MQQGRLSSSWLPVALGLAPPPCPIAARSPSSVFQIMAPPQLTARSLESIELQLSFCLQAARVRGPRGDRLSTFGFCVAWHCEVMVFQPIGRSDDIAGIYDFAHKSAQIPNRAMLPMKSWVSTTPIAHVTRLVIWCRTEGQCCDRGEHN